MLLIEWIFIMIVFGYGLFYVFWPERARRQYLSHFDVSSSTKWYKPKTYLKFRPPAVAFRAFGIVLLGLGIFLVYLEFS